MTKYIIACAVFISFTTGIFAQSLEGKVYGNHGVLANVKILDLQTGKEKATNAQGNFELKGLDFPVRIQFSYVGYFSETLEFQEPKNNIVIRLQKKIDELSEVVLYSPNIPQNIRQSPAAVALINKSDLDRTDNFNLVQNLNYVPGVYVGQGALNTNKINIRGIGARSQYSTNRIKAYINGIPLTTAEGELTLDDFDSEIIERIEIFKGPVSSVFGAGLGGAINVYTDRNLEDQRSIRAGYQVGSFDTRKFTAGINYVKDSLSLQLNYNQLNSEGYRANGQYDRTSLNGTVGYLNKKGNYWSFFYAFTNLKAYIPSSLNENDLKNDPEKAAFTWNASAGYESYDKNILGVSYEHHFTENLSNQTSVFYNSRDGYEPRPFNILDENRNSFGARTRFNLKSNILQKNAQFSFGGEAMLEDYSTGTFQNLYEEFEERKSVQGDRLSLNEQTRKYLNIFAQMNVEISEKLRAEAGINFNTTAYDLEDKFALDEVDQSGNYSFDAIVSPRLGLSYEAFPQKNFYVSLSHGFSTPTVAETLTPEGLINTDLKTEQGWNYEVGFKGNWLDNRLYTEVNLYSIQVTDLLVARRVGQDQYVGVNAGKADHNGIEFNSQYRSGLSANSGLTLGFKSSFNFHTFDKFVDLGENYSGNDLPAIPEYMLNPWIGFNWKELSGNINYQAFGEMALDDANSGYTDAYQLLNLKLNYQWPLSERVLIDFNFGINNIFDESYAASIVPNSVGFGGAAPRYYYPGNPRNYFGGAIIKLDL